MGHGMEYSPTKQTAKNVSIVIQCDNCLKWRVLHAKKKSKADVKVRIESESEYLSYTCGSQFMDIHFVEDDENIMIFVVIRRNLDCNTPIEVTYYNSGNEEMFSLRHSRRVGAETQLLSNMCDMQCSKKEANAMSNWKQIQTEGEVMCTLYYLDI